MSNPMLQWNNLLGRVIGLKFSLSRQPVPAAGESTAEKITSFQLLMEGWHFGDGCEPNLVASINAQLINTAAIRRGWKTDAFPGIKGDIMLALTKRDGQYYEATCETDGTVSIIEEADDEEIARTERLPLRDAVRWLHLEDDPSCVTFDSFIIVTGKTPNVASPAMPSETRLKSTGEEFQLLTLTAHRLEAAASVPMSENFT